MQRECLADATRRARNDNAAWQRTLGGHSVMPMFSDAPEFANIVVALSGFLQ
jgi:hypothetical protein